MTNEDRKDRRKEALASDLKAIESALDSDWKDVEKATEFVWDVYIRAIESIHKTKTKLS